MLIVSGITDVLEVEAMDFIYLIECVHVLIRDEILCDRTKINMNICTVYHSLSMCMKILRCSKP